jgi:hypothetical protein
MYHHCNTCRGFSEACTLRRPDNIESWRCIALAIGLVFLVRFLWQIKDDYCRYSCYSNSYSMVGANTNLSPAKDNHHTDDGSSGGGSSVTVFLLLQMCMAKFVLHVLGAGGAIWGFSEVCTLRRAETLEFWRVVALTTTAIFLIRFALQIRDSIMDIISDEDTAESTGFEEGERLQLGLAASANDDESGDQGEHVQDQSSSTLSFIEERTTLIAS